MRASVSMISSLVVMLAAPLAFAQPQEPLPPVEPPPSAAPLAPPAPPEPAPQATKPAEQPLPTPEGPPRYDLVRIDVGGRVGYVKDSAYDAFATNDTLAQFSIDGTYPVYAKGKLVLGAGLGWDYGGRSDGLRGFSSSMKAHRFSVPLEARWHAVPGLFAFGRLAPGAALVVASVDNGGAEVSGSSWAFSTDASVGASILLGPRSHWDQRKSPRFWLTPEVGYGFTTNASLALGRGREAKDLLGSDEDVRLRSLSLSGVFWRLAVTTTF